MLENIKLIILDMLSSAMVSLYLYFIDGSIFTPLLLFVFVANISMFIMIVIANRDYLRIHYILGKSKRQQWKAYISYSLFSHLIIVFLFELIFGLIRFKVNFVMMALNILLTVILVASKAIFLRQFLRRNL